MSTAVRRYLRRVKRNLCCPRSRASQFLRQLSAELVAWCDEQQNASLEQLTAHFGSPQEVAQEFLSQLDPWEVNRCAYARLKRLYAMLGAVVAAAVLCVAVQVKAFYSAPKEVNIRYTQPVQHHNGDECEMFWVKTNFRGRDYYWEYHSCMEMMVMTGRPETADGTEPYAKELYINGSDGVTHWVFNDLHRFWVKVREEET